MRMISMKNVADEKNREEVVNASGRGGPAFTGDYKVKSILLLIAWLAVNDIWCPSIE